MKILMLLIGLLYIGPGLMAAEPTPAKNVAAKDVATKDDSKSAKPALGINITGNLEAPKVLYILPWKTVEQGEADPYMGSLIDEVYAPIDPVEFDRSIRWYELQQATPAAVTN